MVKSQRVNSFLALINTKNSVFPNILPADFRISSLTILCNFVAYGKILPTLQHTKKPSQEGFFFDAFTKSFF